MPNRSAILIKVKGFECKPGARPGLPRKNLIWNLNGGICIPLLLWRLFTRRKWKSPEGRWNSFDSIAISGEQRAFPSYPKLLRIFFYPLLSLIVKLEAEQSCWNIVSFSEIFYVTLTWFFVILLPRFLSRFPLLNHAATSLLIQICSLLFVPLIINLKW